MLTALLCSASAPSGPFHSPRLSGVTIEPHQSQDRKTHSCLILPSPSAPLTPTHTRPFSFIFSGSLPWDGVTAGDSAGALHPSSSPRRRLKAAAGSGVRARWGDRSPASEPWWEAKEFHRPSASLARPLGCTAFPCLPLPVHAAPLGHVSGSVSSPVPCMVLGGGDVLHKCRLNSRATN